MRQATSAAVVALLACGCSSPSAPSNAPVQLHSEVVDPAGDARVDPQLPLAPDLVRGTADVADGNLTIAVTLTPSTFDSKSMGVDVYLDTDRNFATGAAAQDGIGAGAEYLLVLDSRLGPGTVFQYGPARCPELTPSATFFPDYMPDVGLPPVRIQ